MTVSASWAPKIGCLFWGALSISLTLGAIRRLPAGGELVGLLLYTIGFVPGLLGLRKSVQAHIRSLVHGPLSVSPLKLFPARFLIMMLLMALIGQVSVRAPVDPWIPVGFMLVSASTLLCGSLTYGWRTADFQD